MANAVTKISVGAGVILLLGYLSRNKITAAVKDVIDYTFTKEQEAFLQQLHPSFQDHFRKFIAEVEKSIPYKVLITSGYRTFPEQIKLHNENASNAAAGKSMHNYGLAIDLNLVSKKDGSVIRKKDSSDTWKKTGIVKIADKYKLRWGGDGNFGSYHDPVHFEVPLGGSKMLALALKQYGSESKVIGNRVVIKDLPSLAGNREHGCACC